MTQPAVAPSTTELADLAASPGWPRATVLVVDDEPGMRHFLEKALQPHVGRVMTAGSAEEARALMLEHGVDLLLLDIALPGMNGIELLKSMRALGLHAEAVLITAFADLDTAIEALRAGAADMLLKPFRVTQVLGAVRLALERTRLRRENWVLRRTLSQGLRSADALVGRSIVIRGLQAALQRVSAVDSTVLLTGESGTGKELAARTLHRLGARAAGPFVPVNCATASAAQLEAELFGQVGGDVGLFSYAQGGTLFLDGVGELPQSLQAALLRVLDDRTIRPVGGHQALPVDVRVVAAASQPLAAAVRAGIFREDLLYRLQVVEIKLPPLRAHKEDIADLVAHFIDTLAPQLGVAAIDVTPDELRYLQQYDWPGNVRELRNLIERSLIVGALNVSALYQSVARPPAEPPPPGVAALPTDLHALEKRHILAVLESVAGDKTQAARLLGISRRTLERRVAEWGHA
jgi:DNA-binding NtrC family response regulator